VHASYFICGTPRSGTWLLAGLLDSTGVAGHPHEYFWRDTRRANERSWRVVSSAEYLSRVVETGSTANGVFACKLMWGYIADFLETLRCQKGGCLPGDRGLVEHFFPRPRFIWVWRDDVVAQAVSWALAIQTGRWHHWNSVHAEEPVFDFDQIKALAGETTAHNEAWQQWFADNRFEALSVRFEDLVEDMDGVVRRVLEFLDIDIPSALVVSQRTVKTADARREEWIAKYRFVESATDAPLLHARDAEGESALP
jgi:LPS sulfotransferase NodH